MITQLGRIDDGRAVASTPEVESHPMRIVTREIAFGGSVSWTPERATSVAELFDSLAGMWHLQALPEWRPIIADALARGVGESVGDRAVEVGSGTGVWTPLVGGRFRRTVAVDLSEQMLRGAPVDVAPRVRADAAQLPMATGSLDAVVLINAFLFPSETARVLCRSGVVVWINAWGAQTPIHLSAPDVVHALESVDGSSWAGVSSESGTGTWAVVWRE